MKSHNRMVRFGLRSLYVLFVLLALILLTGCQEAIDQFMAELSADKTQWYVSTTGSDKNTCHTPAQPCRNIATALSRAVPKDTIHIADGEYYEMLSVTKDITIKGASMENTIIDAQMNGGSVIKVEDPTNVGILLFILSDLTLTGGATGNGGGLSVEESSYTSLKNVKITENYANKDGGGIYFNTASWAVLDGVVITDNHTSKTGAGGGIFFSNGDSGSPVALTFRLDISNSLISNNSASRGGGVFNKATLSIVKSTLEGNIATSEGGGVDNQYNADIGQSILRNNQGGVGGGAFTNKYGNMAIFESTIDDNQSTDGCGGGIMGGGQSGKGGLSVITSTISNNTAKTKGGGVCSSSPIYAMNSTFSGNSGGGIYTFNKTGTLDGTNLTIANNIGGGLNLSGPTGTMEVMGKSTMTNVLLSNNGGNNCSLENDATGNDSTITSVTNLSSDGTCPGFIEVDPAIIALADNGGLTRTHGLLPGSPARDTGTEIPGLYTDQRQFTRPLDGNGDGVAKTDIGAFEAENTTFPFKTLFPTFTPTPVDTFTPTPVFGKAVIIPSTNTNCRVGPATVFGVAGIAQAGQQYDITGRNISSDWFRIVLVSGTPCWVSGKAGTLSGDIALVEEVPMDIPTITPTLVPTAVCDSFSAGNCPSYCKVVQKPDEYPRCVKKD